MENKDQQVKLKETKEEQIKPGERRNKVGAEGLLEMQIKHIQNR